MRLSPDSVGEDTARKSKMRGEKIENRKRILLINGKSETLLVGLEQEGCEVTICESPQKAWGFIYPTRPHFIILHLEQPGNGNIYALQECRALADGVPLIIAVQASQSESFIKELGESVSRFLYLPLKPNAVREALHGVESEWRHQF